MKDVVRIRGMKAGLQLIIDKNANFDDVKAIILEKLTAGDKFFIRGTTVFVDKNFLNQEQIEQLRRLFHQHGMLFSDEPPKFQTRFETKVEPAPPASPPQPVTFPAPPPEPAPKAETKTKRIDRTLRSGEEIIYEGSVTLYGNLNPGAKIIAGGSIEILGVCRGIVHAGAFGDKDAHITAAVLRPTQIFIADLIARPPDNIEDILVDAVKSKKTEKHEKAQRAYIENDKIQFKLVDKSTAPETVENETFLVRKAKSFFNFFKNR